MESLLPSRTTGVFIWELLVRSSGCEVRVGAWAIDPPMASIATGKADVISAFPKATLRRLRTKITEVSWRNRGDPRETRWRRWASDDLQKLRDETLIDGRKIGTELS